jgi:hypothetical protein
MKPKPKPHPTKPQPITPKLNHQTSTTTLWYLDKEANIA